MALLVRCPRCNKEIEYSTANPYRPFCSERCKIIDLGNWASDAYAIPGKSAEIPAGESIEESDDSENDSTQSASPTEKKDKN